MPFSLILRPTGPSTLLNSARGSVVGAAPQIGDQSDGSYVSINSSAGSATVIETAWERLPDWTVGLTITGYETHCRVAALTATTDFYGDGFVSIGPMSSATVIAGIAGFNHASPVVGTIYETERFTSATSQMATIFRSADPWMRIRPAYLVGTHGLAMAYHEVWVEVFFAEDDPRDPEPPEATGRRFHRKWPREHGRHWPRPTHQHGARRAGGYT